LELLIVSGMSGAGKSTALKFLEDMGYFCIDNMPPFLIPKFAEICFRPGGGDFEKVALGVDIRGGRLFNELFDSLKEDSLPLPEYKILFLDSADEVLVKRYKETRRNHPLAAGDRLISGIEQEREILKELRAQADFVIDTSHLLARQLNEQLRDVFLEKKSFSNLICTVLSFGFKYGLPTDADLVFDVRFLPNPYYDLQMRPLTGADPAVREFVFENGAADGFLERLFAMLDFLIPQYGAEGKNQLVIAIGCTGGKHRSVAIGNSVLEFLSKFGYRASIKHRDIGRE